MKTEPCNYERELTVDEAVELNRQTCRGHLERGESYTVGTLPSGETRPYETEILSDGRRFHYCADCAESSAVRPRLIAFSIRRLEADLEELAGMVEPPPGEGDRIGDEISALRAHLLTLVPVHSREHVLYRDHIELFGVRFPRCSRAVGIARCTGLVVDGSTDCGAHS